MPKGLKALTTVDRHEILSEIVSSWSVLGKKEEMQKKLGAYRKQGAQNIKRMWIAISILAVIQFIVSIAAAAANEQNTGGYSSATFAAIWSMFMIVGFAIFAQRIVHNNNKNDPMWVGFLIGSAGMLCQLCLMLAAVFFTLGEAATTLGYKTAPADKAFGSFSLFNFIIYFIWTAILVTSRDAISNSAEGAKDDEEEGEAEVAEDGEVQNEDDENADEQI